ncbi:excisionase family DNA-binding protein [Antrihabitans sp. NCIMB 15449]|uniref:Excisionase family DNA-binding protein n=1 Tax=Antrihabitans spumae TaxID=3373370 RepID=A0ABW7JT87_9NOCA
MKKHDRSGSGTPVLISIQKGAELVGVHPRTLRRWIAEGRLTGYRLGSRAIRVDKGECFSLAQPFATAGDPR